jgi:hypothetical protein
MQPSTPVKPVRLLAVFAENKPDQVTRITRVLADADVNIHWVGIADVQQFGVIRFLVDRSDRAHDALKQGGFTVSFVEVLAVDVEDRPGALHAVADTLSAACISLNNCSGFVFNGRAILILETSNLDHARLTLADQNLHLLAEEEILRL